MKLNQSTLSEAHRVIKETQIDANRITDEAIKILQSWEATLAEADRIVDEAIKTDKKIKAKERRNRERTKGFKKLFGTIRGFDEDEL